MDEKKVMSSYPTIQPHWSSKATDICSDGGKVYIIRSDLNCYMVTSDLHQGTDITVRDLHPSCQGGDHYFANFYGCHIIKGDSCRYTEDLTTDRNGRVFDLHPNCRGGTHYACVCNKIGKKRLSLLVIIWADQGRARTVTDLGTDSDGNGFSLSDHCKGGLYYWLTMDHDRPLFNFLKPVDKWGVQYHITRDLGNNWEGKDLAVSPDVTPFLPGGLILARGHCYGRWELLQSFVNECDIAIDDGTEVERTVGYKKTVLESIEHHWDIKISAQFPVAKLLMSVEASYGGSIRKTKQEEWEDSITITKSIKFKAEPGQTIYIWQYQVGFGSNAVLFARNIKATRSNVPPTDDPLF